jgi:hypothetical protein
MKATSTLPPQPKALPDLNRPVKYTSQFYFSLYSKIWGWCFVTLIFDFALLLGLPLLQLPSIDSEIKEFMEMFCVLLALTSLCWFATEFVINKTNSLVDNKDKLAKLLDQNPLIFLAVLLIAALLLAVIKAGQFELPVTIGIAAVLFLGFLSPAKKALKKHLEQANNQNVDLAKKVEAFNKRMFSLHLIPMLAARILITVSVVIFALASNIQPIYLLYLSFGAVMLSVMQAEERYFMIICPRCGQKTSRFLKPYSACLSCVKKG